jgi:hypothetical protein
MGGSRVEIGRFPSLRRLFSTIVAVLAMHDAFVVVLHEACRMQGSEVEASFVSLVSLRHRLPTQPCLLRCSATLLHHPHAKLFTLTFRTKHYVLLMYFGDISGCYGSNDGNTRSNEGTMPPRVSSAD